MDDPRRIRVTEVRTIGRDLASLKGTPYFREGYTTGYAAANNQLFNGAPFAEGTPVVVVGRISSAPKGVKGIGEEKKMQVAVGPEKTDYTLHMRHADLVGFHGQEVKEDELKDGQWVRAEGRVMNDPRRIQVSRLQALGAGDPQFRSSAFYRPGFEQGYVMAVAGSRETFPKSEHERFAAVPLTIVGRVTDDTGPLDTMRRIRVQAAGNEWTLNVTDKAAVTDETGKKISIHEVHGDQWIRAQGWQTGDLRMRAFRLEEIGRDEAFRTSKLYRQDFPMGYVDRTLGDRTEFSPVKLRGTVVSVEPVYEYFVVRDSDDKAHRVYGDDVVITGPNGAALILENVHPGDVISIEGRTIDLDPVAEP